MTAAALPDPRDDAAGDPSLLKDCGYRTALIGKWRHGISDATHYKWKSKYGGMEASDLKWVKDLEAQATYAIGRLEPIARRFKIAPKRPLPVR